MGGAIPAGEYVIAALEPTVRLKVGKGWVAWTQDTPPMLIENPRQEAGQLIFTSPRYVFHPSTLSEPKEAPAPENAEEWVSWFQRHPNLETSKPAPVSVGGAFGMRIDVTPVSKLENHPQRFCDEKPCSVPLYSTTRSDVDWKDRFFIVDVESETIIIDVSAPAGRFDEFLPEAQKVLDTVKWEGARAP